MKSNDYCKRIRDSSLQITGSRLYLSSGVVWIGITDLGHAGLPVGRLSSELDLFTNYISMPSMFSCKIGHTLSNLPPAYW